MSRTLVQELNDLHDAYVVAVNEAVAADDVAGAELLAAAYDDDAVRLVAEREGLTHLLPLRRPTPDTPLRRLVARVRLQRAA